MATGASLDLMQDWFLVSLLWNQLAASIKKWLDQPLLSTPHLCLPRDKSVLPAGLWLALAGFLNPARIIIRNWKNISTPCCEYWIEPTAVKASHQLTNWKSLRWHSVKCRAASSVLVIVGIIMLYLGLNRKYWKADTHCWFSSFLGLWWQ